MFDFLKKSFPKLNKESPFYIQAMSNIIVKPHNKYEPLDGKDVFIDGLFAGQIEKLPSSFDPIDSTYYRGFYLHPDSDAKKKLIDEIYRRIQQAVDDEIKAYVEGRTSPVSITSSILDDIKAKTEKLNTLSAKQTTLKEITIDRDDVAFNFYASLTDLVFSNFASIMADMVKNNIFCNIYLKYDDHIKIEIRCEWCDCDKNYRTYIWLSNWTDNLVFASTKNWPERYIHKGRLTDTDEKEIYPAVNKIKKHYEDLGAKNDDEIKQMFLDDIAKQLVEHLDRSIESREWSIKHTKENYNIENE